MSEKKNYWYSLDNIRSYNCLFNFIILLRGVGKTYAFKKFAIREALDKKDLFLYLRRTDVEVRDAEDSFLNDVGKEFPGKEFRIYKDKLQYNLMDCETGEYLQDWNTLGYFAYLSNARRKKSVSYEGVKYMAFDEFLIPPADKYAKYLPEEVTVFLDFYETVARMRDVQVFFLSNAMSTINPYFLHWKLVLPRNKTGIKRIGEDIAIEFHDNAEYREAKQATRFGKLIAGSSFEQYALGNEFITENSEFLLKKTQKSYYQYTIQIGDDIFGVYRDSWEQKIFISEDVDMQCPLRYRYKQGGKGFLVFKTRRTIRLIDELVMNFERGLVFFESQKIKQVMLQFFERVM